MRLDRKYLIAVFPLILIGLLFYYFSDIMFYIIAAWVLSMLGAPLMRLFMRFSGRNVAAMLTLFAFTMFFVLLSWLFVPPIVKQARNLAGIDYNSILASLDEPVNDFNNWMIKKGLIADPNETNSLDEVQNPDSSEDFVISEVIRLDSIQSIAGDSLMDLPIALVINIDRDRLDGPETKEVEGTGTDNMLQKVRNNFYKQIDPSRIPKLFGSVFGFLSNFLIAIMSVYFIAFFFLKEQGLFSSMVRAVVPTGSEGKVSHALEDSTKMLVRYFIGVSLQIFVITLFVTLALTLFGIKNALLIGFFAALMNVIPYLGPLFGAAFGVFITISSNLDLAFYDGTLPMLLKVILVFVIMQLLDNFLVQPNIFSKSVKAHPLEIFIIVLVGAKLGGITGMVIAIPLYTVLRVIARVFLSEFKLVQRITSNM